MTATGNNRFIHSMAARFLGLVIGVGLLAFMFINWGDEMKHLAASLTDGEKAVLVQPVGQVRVKNDNPGLAACLEERIGHVEQMKADGVINEHQYGQFSGRARALCQEQNPG